MDAINDKFAEARDEIDYANEDAESTYFDESYKAAEAATNEARPAQALRMVCLVMGRGGRHTRGAQKSGVPNEPCSVWLSTRRVSQRTPCDPSVGRRVNGGRE